MAIAIDFYESIQSFLHASYWVTDKTGPTINAGESFNVRIVVSNRAPGVNRKKGVPVIIFRNLKMKLTPLPSADPFIEVKELGSLQDTVLRNRDYTSVDAVFVARRALSGELESVARLSVTGNLDQDAFFGFRRDEGMRIDLEP